jgi:hypothetical protein
MCLGHGSSQHNHSTPELESKHLSGISFNKTTYIMPWAMYTIPPGSIKDWKAMGNLTTAGKRLVQQEFVKMLG